MGRFNQDDDRDTHSWDRDDFTTGRDYGDENDYPQDGWLDDLESQECTETRYREQTIYDLINALEEYLSFSSKADLKRLLKEQFDVK